MGFSENAKVILEMLYYRKDKNGKPLEKTPEQLFERVADFVVTGEKDSAAAQNLKKELLDLMNAQKFMFSSPTLFNAGSDFPLASSCFVGKLEDSMIGIMQAATDTAITFKAGAGMGLNFGILRPYGSAVGRGGASSGPVKFMQLFNEVGETVKSGGVRRAAFMAMMDVNHPDIEAFIASKDYIASLKRANPNLNIPDDLTDRVMDELTGTLAESISDDSILRAVVDEVRRKLFEPLSNMNISVAITDKFMAAVKDDADFELDRHPDYMPGKSVKARELFRKIALSAWRTADPGVWFIDKANHYDTVPSFGRIDSTNPCGEQSLHHYTSCNLGSINLVKFVSGGKFDYDEFNRVVKIATRALDNIIDIAAFPTENFTKNTRLIRPVGLGYTGLAETLYMLKIAYNSPEGYEFAANVSRLMTQGTILASIELASEKGSLPVFEENAESLIRVAKGYFDSDDEKAALEASMRKNGIRNSNWTTLAPTGSISLILDAYTYSLEPQFALAYNKNLIDGGVLTYVDPEFEKAVKDKSLIAKVVENGGSCKGIDGIPESVKKVFVTAHDISFDDRIAMQSAIQRYVSNSISSTINLPESITVDEIERIYLKAWESNLKGVTIYRDGCKHFQPMTTNKKASAPVPAEAVSCRKWTRPNVLKAEIARTKTGNGTLYTSIGLDEAGIPVELFINISKHGSGESAFSEALGRVISIALQHGVPVDRIADTIIGIVGDKPTWDNGKLIKSIPDAVGRILKDYAERLNAPVEEASLFSKPSGVEKAEIDYTNPVEIPGAEVCPACGEKALVRTEDCQSCLSCGYSKCG